MSEELPSSSLSGRGVLAALAEVTRGNVIEAVHEGSVAVVDGTGELVAWAGDPATTKYFRSSAKPFQAVPLVASGTADDYGLTTQELAICCASHNASEHHQSVVRSVLRKAGLSEGDLECGFTEPVDEEERARIALGLKEPTSIQCECSGEHAGMLATCRHANWSIDGYIRSGHPLQSHIRQIIAAACGIPASFLREGTDGCSLPTYAAQLMSFARAYAVLADPEGADWDGCETWIRALLRLRGAMTRHPDMIAGEGETDTVIMQLTAGRVVAKLGAEGMLCLAIPAHRLGIAIADHGGSSRSLGPAAVAVLEQLTTENESVISNLRERLCPPVKSFAGEPVGATRPALQLMSD